MAARSAETASTDALYAPDGSAERSQLVPLPAVSSCNAPAA
ncbi:hypothetical protein [Anaeromyxobacter oryzisoli]|nr:hypothetical protein [Anaeromyxobacter sp. SG63]